MPLDKSQGGYIPAQRVRGSNLGWYSRVPRLWWVLGGVGTALLVIVIIVLAVTLSGSAVILEGDEVLDVVPLIDGHNDLPWNLKSLASNKMANFDFTKNFTNDPVWNCTSCFTDLPKLRAGKVGGQFWVAYVSCNSQYKDAVEQTLEQIDVIKRLIKAYPNDLQFADSSESTDNMKLSSDNPSSPSPSAFTQSGRFYSLVCYPPP